MAEPALTKVSIGVNKNTFAPIWYLEARIAPDQPWRLVVDAGKVCTHRSKTAAEREAKKLQKRLRAKLN